MNNSDRNSSAYRRNLLQAVFVIWLGLANFLYYLQFKALFLARLAALMHR